MSERHFINEENNEEAVEHFIPRHIIELMSHLIFLPLKDNIESSATLFITALVDLAECSPKLKHFSKKSTEVTANVFWLNYMNRK
jgi:type I restriction-modification system DNA methylase subunit